MSKEHLSINIDKALKHEGQKLALNESIESGKRVTLTDIVERALIAEIKKSTK